ncbi:MAG: alpha/beta hydrolase [Myxococcales bacterium]|nr:alpha/beta hydrolase [Myxococcales bacterium]MCB9524632.1 alpha/beta hydrolase [Myxococcales bacterium]
MHTRLFPLAATLGVALLAGCLDPSQAGHLVPKTVDQDPALPQVAFNGSRFHFQAFGPTDAPVIIMLHGGPGSDHRGLLRLRQAVDGRRLEDRWRVVYWDQRGAGLSQRHDAAELTMARYDADLDWLVDHVSPGRPVWLVGHSWGGMYATAYLSNHPEKVAGAVLLEPGPLTGALFEEVRDGIVNLDVFAEWLNDYTWATRILSPDDHARADFLQLTALLSPDAQPGFGGRPDDDTVYWRFGVVANQAIQADGMAGGKGVWDFTTGLAQTQAPVRLVASSRNEVIGEAFQRRQLGFFSNADLVVIDDSGHEFPQTHPAATLRVIFEHLDAGGRQ